MAPLPEARHIFGAISVLAGCGRDGAPQHGGLCSDPPSEAAAMLCSLDEASAQAALGRGDAAARLCEGLSDNRWLRDCYYRVAEGLSHAGKPDEGFAICGLTGGALQLCMSHVAWVASESLVDAGPGDAEAQSKVDALVAALPPRPVEIEESHWKVDSQVRAAAWHGIYAGSGSADPTAALAARPDDLPLARSALAWEASRLLGPTESLRARLVAVRRVWSREQEAPVGEPQAQACWSSRVMPRPLNSHVVRLPTVHVYQASSRVVSQDPEADLVVAVVEATWSQGMDFDAREIRWLLGQDDSAVRLTGAKQVGLWPDRFPSVEAVIDPGDETALLLATSTREAVVQGIAPRAIDFPATRACPR